MLLSQKFIINIIINYENFKYFSTTKILTYKQV